MHRYRVVIMLVLFGVLPVVAAFFLALSYLGEPEPEPEQAEAKPAVEQEPPPKPPPKPPETRRVLAASRALPVGTLLGDEHFTEIEVDPEAIGKEHVLAPEGTAARPLRGYVVREAIEEGAPFARPAVVGPKQSGFLAAVLEPGHRAVTIQVGPATSHAGLVDPGDRVDVILSAEIAVDGRDRSVLATTIVEDVRVVAIDGQPIGPPAGSGAESPAEDGEGETNRKRTAVTTATLEVTPAQGERLVLGEREGALSLAVRSLATAADQTASAAPSGTPANLKAMLLSPADFSASEERLERGRKLNDLSMRKQIADARQELQAAKEAGATTLDTVRIFRGSEPAEQVGFAHR